MTTDPVRIDRAEVRRLARLAGLEIPDDAEADRLVMDLRSILAMVEQLREVDVSGAAESEGLARPAQAERPDRAHAPDASRDLLATAPSVADGYIQVPRVLE